MEMLSHKCMTVVAVMAAETSQQAEGGQCKGFERGTHDATGNGSLSLLVENNWTVAVWMEVF